MHAALFTRPEAEHCRNSRQCRAAIAWACLRWAARLRCRGRRTAS